MCISIFKIMLNVGKTELRAVAGLIMLSNEVCNLERLHVRAERREY